jgi:hypothetical protein
MQLVNFRHVQNQNLPLEDQLGSALLSGHPSLADAPIDTVFSHNSRIDGKTYVPAGQARYYSSTSRRDNLFSCQVVAFSLHYLYCNVPVRVTPGEH